MSWKKSVLVIYLILRLFANTLTADDKYSRCNMQNFQQQFQTSLSIKEETFSGLFIAFLKCASNVEHFEKKEEYPRIVNSEIYEFERGVPKQINGFASEHHSVINVLTSSKHCSNQHSTTINLLSLE